MSTKSLSQSTPPIFIPFVLKGLNKENIEPIYEKKQMGSLQLPQKDIINIHENIKAKLDLFRETNKIPHIIFHGSSGTGKFTLVYDFIKKIYGGDKQKIKTNVMIVNCSHGKGIKFIREELKFFAKINIQNNAGVQFKTILLLNAHHLTIDAQSALRRCIELFSYNTRFFIIVENKNKLLNPILSRFSDIYIPEYIQNGKIINLHQYHISKQLQQQQQQPLIKNNTIDGSNNGQMYLPIHDIVNIGVRWGFLSIINDDESKNNIKNIEKVENVENVKKGKLCIGEFAGDVVKINEMVEEMYNAGISCIDIMNWAETCGLWDITKLTLFRMKFNSSKIEFRCEKLLMFWIIEMFLTSNMSAMSNKNNK